MNPIRIAVHGTAGRMGRRVVTLATEDEGFSVVAGLEAPGHPQLGQDVGLIGGVGLLGVPLSDTLDTEADLVVDFSLPRGFDAIVSLCLARRLPLVTATTGLDDGQVVRRQAAAEQIPLLWAPNMSLAVNLAMKLSQSAAEALKDQDADVEIIERHHRFKEDAPSGTALVFGQIISEVMGQTGHCHGRQGRPGPRPHEEIGYHAVRVGDNPGEHAVIFAMLGEMLELTVRASSRDCYAKGALAAAKFLVGKPPGQYGMADVLGL